jgi:hypothetical protein
MVHIDKELRRTLQPYIDKGCILENSKKHLKLRTPNGKMVTMSKSPSCPYYLHNIVRDIKRVYDEN